MRADMGKVLVERPRVGRNRAQRWPGKGYRKRLKKYLDAGDSPPQREGMKESYGHGTKHFNEHLGPLRRFLNSNVGRPWDKVYSEICQHVDRGNVVQKHILTHLFDYVVVNTTLIDGEPCCGDRHRGYRYGESLRTTDRWHQWYVCPKSGLLRESKYVPRDRRKRPDSPRRVVLNKSQMCLFLGGQWELVTVAPLPGLYQLQRMSDVVLKRRTGGWPSDHSEAARVYGAHVYATARRPLSRKELLALPIPIEWLK